MKPSNEDHYYSFGLTMAGISSQAAGGMENKVKFQKQELQHKEFSDGSGLEMYEFKYRMDDPQTGRFWQIDPLAPKYVYNSTYAFSENKVTSHVELEGSESQGVNEDVKDAYADPSLENRSYKTIEDFVPNVTYGTSGINVYEKQERGDGAAEPTITRDNSMGKFVVLATRKIDELKEDIQNVTEETEHRITPNGVDNSVSSIQIEWKDNKSGQQFNDLQNQYDTKVKEIDNKYPAPPMPAANASPEDKFKYNLKLQEVAGIKGLQKSLLGPSPTQVIKNSLNNKNGGFTKVSEKTEPLAEIRQAHN